ncbi:8-demethylnovobiocic acid C(8)-methyltransferase [Stieleria magnilauensis]|uniref:8-demethylnovobiocic acid C(8)-methyltransferase n=2 Tax=Stieleria magnilauensis TaxID=2527963 RepID=A0ABX5XQG9_9BACT|nr:8-demethylnovobiocic acid C(8)-methyltransferase [Planctomycetes bacterium TBK1r]
MNTPQQPGRPSLVRTLEPEPMDDESEVQEYQQMDHEGVNGAFVDDLIGGGTVGPKVVDLGCGTAAIPVLLCQRLSEIEVLGVDCSVEMLEAARIEIELGSVTGRVFLEHADCKVLDGFQDDAADTVISNTMLHHVAEPERVIAQAIRILAPGGRLFLRDLARPASEAEVEGLVDLHAAGESDYGRQLLRQSLHAALTVDEAVDILAGFGVPSEAVRMTSDRHWTVDWIKTN